MTTGRNNLFHLKRFNTILNNNSLETLGFKNNNKIYNLNSYFYIDNNIIDIYFYFTINNNYFITKYKQFLIIILNKIFKNIFNTDIINYIIYKSISKPYLNISLKLTLPFNFPLSNIDYNYELINYKSNIKTEFNIFEYLKYKIDLHNQINTLNKMNINILKIESNILLLLSNINIIEDIELFNKSKY